MTIKLDSLIAETINSHKLMESYLNKFGLPDHPEFFEKFKKVLKLVPMKTKEPIDFLVDLKLEKYIRNLLAFRGKLRRELADLSYTTNLIQSEVESSEEATFILKKEFYNNLKISNKEVESNTFLKELIADIIKYVVDYWASFPTNISTLLKYYDKIENSKAMYYLIKIREDENILDTKLARTYKELRTK